MPLIFYRSHTDVEVALWKATESLDFFREKLQEHEFDAEDGDAIAHPEKALQWFASRYLLVEVFPAAIPFYKSRKPHLLNGPGISLSHSNDVVGVLLSTGLAGLDVQVFTSKLERILRKFTDDDEVARMGMEDRIAALALIWSVKEAVFKCYGTELPFKDIRITKHDMLRDRVQVEGQRRGRPFQHVLATKFLDDMAVAYVLLSDAQ